ncbi:hypothetical protein ACMD2_12478, partial [Ananas comosus]
VHYQRQAEYLTKLWEMISKGPSEVTVIRDLSRATATASPRAPALPPATLIRSWRNFSRTRSP